MGILDRFLPAIDPTELPFEFKIVRSNRRNRTTSLVIDATGTVVVTAPNHVSERWILKWLNEKKVWIQRQIRTRGGVSKKRSFQEGDTYYFRGVETVLSFVTNDQVLVPRLIHKSGHFTIETPKLYKDEKKPIIARTLIERFLMKKGKQVFEERVTYFASKLNVEYQDIRLKEVSSIWGSCSSAGNLNFNWRLIMAPPEILDYVVAHEVSHLNHPHHGPSFWKSVLSLDLEYREHVRWLKKNSGLLSID